MEKYDKYLDAIAERYSGKLLEIENLGLDEFHRWVNHIHRKKEFYNFPIEIAESNPEDGLAIKELSGILISYTRYCRKLIKYLQNKYYEEED